jgi:hypothetical protein
MVVDNTGSDVLARAVDYECISRRVDRRAYRRDLTVLQENRAVPDEGPGRGQNVDVADDGRSRRERDVCARKGIGVGRRCAPATGVGLR